MLTALSQTPEGAALVDGVVAKLGATPPGATAAAAKAYARGKAKDANTVN